MGMVDCIIAGGTESMSMVPASRLETVPAYSIALRRRGLLFEYGINRQP